MDDIDLYSGALNEEPVEGGSVGPTYACLIAKQFRALKYGDRFWYERTTSEGFTAGLWRSCVMFSHMACGPCCGMAVRIGSVNAESVLLWKRKRWRERMRERER